MERERERVCVWGELRENKRLREKVCVCACGSFLFETKTLVFD